MTPIARRLPAALVAAGALAAAGCGITDPYTSHHHATTAAAPAASRTATATATSSTTPSPSAVHTNDPSEPAAGTPTTAPDSTLTGPAAGAGASSPQAALQRYAQLYVNWTAKTLGADQLKLAALSEGTARAKALQAAASYRKDPLLQNGQVSDHGQIVSVSAGHGPAQGSWVIVTSEHTSGQGDYSGLPAAAHVTYAQLTHRPQGWVVSQWSPQN